MNCRSGTAWRFLWISLGIFALDQATKLLVIAELRLNEQVVLVPGVLYLTHIQNAGAAWGILREHPSVLTILAALTLAALLAFARCFQGAHCGTRTGWALLVGGIAGNLVDRIRLGRVTDFLDVLIGSYHWPAFNVADAAICAGVACYIIDSFYGRPVPAASSTAASDEQRATD